MSARNSGPGGMHRDWFAMLLPIFITIAVSVVANVGVGIWEAASFKGEVRATVEHQKIQDEAIKANSDALQALLIRLPIDYKPRTEIEKDYTDTKEMRDLENKRIDSIEQKIDQILMNTQRQR